MVIKWSPLALQTLKEIYQFYLPKTGKEKAQAIVTDLKRETRYLLIFPEMGRKEPVDIPIYNYRYIVAKKHYKIYYIVFPTYILIGPVWDTRRNPDLLTQLLNSPLSRQ